MRFGGCVVNLLTSCCFIWTMFHARLRNCRLLEIGCVSCLVTSVLYHGSRTFAHSLPWLVVVFRLVDMIICQCCVIVGLLVSYQCASFHWLYIGTIVSVAYIFSMYYIFRASERTVNGDMWHSSLHIVSNIGISFLIEACTYANPD